MNTLLAFIAAIAVLLWPKREKSPAVVKLDPLTPPAPAVPKEVDYQAAMAALAVVRSRLSRTEHLADAEAKAISTITLALVAGSDV
jgi:hypothetical protein